MQARLQKGPDGYKKGGAPAHPVFLKAPPRRAEREWRSPNPARGQGNGGAQIPSEQTLFLQFTVGTYPRQTAL